MIRARDPRLHRISVAYEGFVVPQGIPLPRYSPLIEPLPVATLAAGATFPPPPPVFQVEEEEEFKRISNVEVAHTAWNILQTVHEGTKAVKINKL